MSGNSFLCVTLDDSVKRLRIVLCVCIYGYRERQTEMYSLGRKFSKRESGRER